MFSGICMVETIKGCDSEMVMTAFLSLLILCFTYKIELLKIPYHNKIGDANLKFALLI